MATQRWGTRGISTRRGAATKAGKLAAALVNEALAQKLLSRDGQYNNRKTTTPRRVCVLFSPDMRKQVQKKSYVFS